MENIVVIQTETRIVSVAGEQIVVPVETVKIVSVGTQGPPGTTDHGTLSGLTDDDHTQYHNDARGDARYYTEAEIDIFLAAKVSRVLTVTVVSGTTYTLSAADSGTVLSFTSNSAITLTCPNNLSVGFNVGILQIGSGAVTPTAESGAVIRNGQSHTITARQYAPCSLLVYANSGGAAANYIFGGDTA